MSSLRLAFILPDLLRTAAGTAPSPMRADAPAATIPPAPGLARLLAAAGMPALERDGLGAALAALYGIARQADWPLAPIRAAALGIDPGDDYWLAADPVTLVAGRDDVRLTGAVTDLSTGEADALLATLNAHFASDGLHFVAPRPDAWLVSAASAPAMQTRPLDVALGRTLRDLLAAGPEAGRWRRWQNEIQMLLFDHPVNTAREARGLAVANSVWFSGGGTQPTRDPVALRTYADSGLATALASFAGEPARAVPPSLAQVLAQLSSGAFADAAGASSTVVALAAPLDVAAVETAWTAPAWRALSRGRVDAVTLIGDGVDGAAVWTARRPGAWQRFAARFGDADLAPLLATARAAPAADT